ncbi:hypothetical protein, partial [Rhizorhabdus wittichii]|uniref:hypothetical protein n=1 Tax=Rhizorhabdus wittichii TaxID=160791 RepID=UPI001D018CDE
APALPPPCPAGCRNLFENTHGKTIPLRIALRVIHQDSSVKINVLALESEIPVKPDERKESVTSY